MRINFEDPQERVLMFRRKKMDLEVVTNYDLHRPHSWSDAEGVSCCTIDRDLSAICDYG